MKNYFDIFSIPAAFDIDLDALEKAYHRLVQKYHPDNFANHDNHQNDDLRAEGIKNTSLINTAFETLKSPLGRARYLLELAGIDAFDEKNTRMDGDFLQQQIMLREELDEMADAENLEKLDDFIERTDAYLRQNVIDIRLAFSEKNLARAEDLVREMRFYQTLNTDAKKRLDALF